MNARGQRLSRPLYEALPWIYMVMGVVALAASYFQSSGFLSFVLGAFGFVAVVGGVVVALRRRDFRQLRANQYLADDSTAKRDE
jgi:uncharacterized membrane protein